LAQSLTNRVRIDLFVQKQSPIFVPGRQECPFCDDVQTLMEEIASLSSRISLTRHELSDAPKIAADLSVDLVPGIVLRGPNNRAIRYFGMPTSAEFPVFVEMLMETSRGTSGLELTTERQLRRIRDEVKLQVFVTPSCAYSPPVARTALRLGLQNVKVKAEVIEATEFPQLIQRYSLRATPTVVIDEKLVLPGAIEEATLVECLLRAVEGKPLASTLNLGPTTPFGQTQQPEMRTSASGLIIPG
jgi:glutaredoxin-like protein